MIIRNIKIHQFGKLMDLTLNFDKGIQLIEGRNESGKSTLQCFFLWMFYGGIQLRELGIHLRELAVPFEGEFAFGQMEVEMDGVPLVIERKTGKMRKEDLLRICNKDTSEQVFFEDPIGKSFFQLSAKEFVKTLFMGQEQVRFATEKNDSLSSKLTNLIETGEEEISYGKAVEELERRMKDLKAGKNKGLLSEIQNEIGSLYLELDKAKSSSVKENELRENLKTMEFEQNTLEEQLSLLSDLKSKSVLMGKKQEILQLKDHLDHLTNLKSEKEAGWITISEEEFIRIQQQIEEYGDIEAEYQEIKRCAAESKRAVCAEEETLKEFECFRNFQSDVLILLLQEEGEEKLLNDKMMRLKDSVSEVEKLGSRKKEIQTLLKRYEKHLKGLRKRKWEFVGGLVISTFLGGLLVFYPVSPLAMVQLLFMMLTFYFSPKIQHKVRLKHFSKSQILENRIQQICEELSLDSQVLLKSKKHLKTSGTQEGARKLKQRILEIRERRMKILMEYHVESLVDLAQKAELYTKMKTEYFANNSNLTLLYEKEAHLHSKLENKRLPIINVLVPLGFNENEEDPQSFVERYELNRVRMNHLKEQELQLQLAVKGLIGENTLEDALTEMAAIESLSLLEDYTDASMAMKEALIHQELDSVNSGIEQVQAELNSMKYRNPSLLEDLILSKQVIERDLIHRYTILVRTKDVIMDAKNRIREKYVETLSGEVTRIFQQVTGRSREIHVEDLNMMQYQEGQVFVDERLLSRGALTQLYFTLRLVMISKMFTSQTVPIFMDEVFSSFDDERTQNAIRMLESEFQEHQIFIFTSQSRERRFLAGDARNIVLE